MVNGITALVFILIILCDFGCGHAFDAVHVLIEVHVAFVGRVVGQQVDQKTRDDVDARRRIVVVRTFQNRRGALQLGHDVRDDVLDTFVGFHVIRRLDTHVLEHAHQRVAEEGNQFGRKDLPHQGDQQLAGRGVEVGELHAGAGGVEIALGRETFRTLRALRRKGGKVEHLDVRRAHVFFRAGYEPRKQVVQQRFKVKVLFKQALDVERDDAFEHRVGDCKQLKHGRDQVFNRDCEVVLGIGRRLRLIHEVGKVRQRRGKHGDRLFKQRLNAGGTVQQVADTGEELAERGIRHLHEAVAVLERRRIPVCGVVRADAVVLAVHVVVELVLIHAGAGIFQADSLKDRDDRFRVAEAAADGQLVGDRDRFAREDEVQDRGKRLQERHQEARQFFIAGSACRVAGAEPVDVVGCSVEAHFRPGEVVDALAELGRLTADPGPDRGAADVRRRRRAGAACRVIEALRGDVEVDSSREGDHTFENLGVADQLRENADVVVDFAGFRIGFGIGNVRTEQEIHQNVNELVRAKNLGDRFFKRVDFTGDDPVDDLGQTVFLDQRLERFEVAEDRAEERHKGVDDRVDRFRRRVRLRDPQFIGVVAVLVEAVVGKEGGQVFAELEVGVPFFARRHLGQQTVAFLILEGGIVVVDIVDKRIRFDFIRVQQFDQNRHHVVGVAVKDAADHADRIGRLRVGIVRIGLACDQTVKQRRDLIPGAVVRDPAQQLEQHKTGLRGYLPVGVAVFQCLACDRTCRQQSVDRQG